MTSKDTVDKLVIRLAGASHTAHQENDPTIFTKYATQQINSYMLSLIGEDEKSKHVRRFQCPNYENGCYEWADQWKMNSTPPYCSTDGKKMKSVEFDEQDGDDWVRNEFRAELRTALTNNQDSEE